MSGELIISKDALGNATDGLGSVLEIVDGILKALEKIPEDFPILGVISGLAEILSAGLGFDKEASNISKISDAASTLAGLWGVISACLMPINPLAGIISGIVAGISELVSVIAHLFSGEALSGLEKASGILGILAAIIGMVALFLAPIPAAIAGVVAGVLGLAALIVDNWGATADFFVNLWDGICGTFDSAVSWIDTNVIQPIGVFFTNLGTSVQTAFQTAIDFITGIFSNIVAWISTNVITPVSDFFCNLWTGITDAFQSGINFITGIFNNVVNWINTNVISPVSNFFSGLWSGINNAFQSGINFITGIFSNIVSWISSNVIAPVSNFFSGLWSGINNSFQTGLNFITGIFSSTFNGVYSVISGIFDRIEGAWSGLTGFVSNVFSGVGDAVNQLVKQVKGFVNGVIGGINSAIGIINKIPMVNIPNIPYLQHGTSNWQGGFAYINEGGRGELTYLPNGAQVIPHDISVRYAKEAAKANAAVARQNVLAVSGGNSDNGQPLEVKLYLDGKQITTAVEKVQKERGLSLINGGVAYGF